MGLQTIISKLTLPLGCVRRIDKRAKRVPHFTYTSEDISYGALFLASDESSFMTGSELVIDGGYTAK